MTETPYDFDLKLAEYSAEEDLQKRRDIIYSKLSEFARKREDWYRNESNTNIKKLLSKASVMSLLVQAIVSGSCQVLR